MSKQQNTFIIILFLLAPTLIGIQSVLPKNFGTFLVYFRLLIVPVLIIWFLRDLINFYLFSIFIIYIVILTLIFPPSNFNDYFITFLSLFSSIAFFKLGNFIAGKENYSLIFIYLIYGINIFNILVISVYIALIFNIIDIQSYMIFVGKDYLETYRFSFSNPIEIPFVMTSLLFASLILMKGKGVFLFSTSINLFASVISESRIVVIIALVIFIIQFIKSSGKYKIFVIFMTIIILPFFLESFGQLFNSFYLRLIGNDPESGNIRQSMLKNTIDSITHWTFLFGDGITSSSELMKKHLNNYQTIETVLLQMFFEIGILGSLLFTLTFLSKKTTIINPFKINFIMFLMYIQLLLFLPIYSFMPMNFFLFGVFMKKNQFNTITNNHKIYK